MKIKFDWDNGKKSLLNINSETGIVSSIIDIEDGVVEKNLEIRYMQPKTDKNRVFNFVKCEYKENNEWKKGTLYALLVKDGYCFNIINEDEERDLASQVRIPEFSPENPPPVDTPALVKTITGLKIQHFNRYESGEVWFRDNGKTSFTCFSSTPYDHYDFVDFTDSSYEWIKE